MSTPPRKPTTAPTSNWIASGSSTSLPKAAGPAEAPSRPTSATVRKMAIGSLEPDSTSSVERTRSRRLMPPTRSRKKTAAASVGATMTPSSRPCSQEKPSTSCAANPTSSAVTSTPTVASSSAGSAATRSVASRVAKPESNRMMASATEPTKYAAPRLSNWMPSPSSPAASPTSRKTSSKGAPKRKDKIEVNAAAATSAEPIRIATFMASNMARAVPPTYGRQKSVRRPLSCRS